MGTTQAAGWPPPSRRPAWRSRGTGLPFDPELRRHAPGEVRRPTLGAGIGHEAEEHVLARLGREPEVGGTARAHEAEATGRVRRCRSGHHIVDDVDDRLTVLEPVGDDLVDLLALVGRPDGGAGRELLVGLEGQVHQADLDVGGGERRLGDLGVGDLEGSQHPLDRVGCSGGVGDQAEQRVLAGDEHLRAAGSGAGGDGVGAAVALDQRQRRLRAAGPGRRREGTEVLAFLEPEDGGLVLEGAAVGEAHLDRSGGDRRQVGGEGELAALATRDGDVDHRRLDDRLGLGRRRRRGDLDGRVGAGDRGEKDRRPRRRWRRRRGG